MVSQGVSVPESAGNVTVCLSVELVGVFESDLIVDSATADITASQLSHFMSQCAQTLFLSNLFHCSFWW